MKQPAMNKSFLTTICKSKRVWLLVSVMVIYISTIAIGSFAYLNKFTDLVQNNFTSAGYSYTLTYDANGGIDAPTEQTAIDSAKSHDFTVPDFVPTRAGYEFFGWAEASDKTTKVYVAGDKVTLPYTAPTKTLYAVWEKPVTLTTGAEVNNAMRNNVKYSENEKSITFGKMIDYKKKIGTTVGKPMDADGNGSIMLYRVPDISATKYDIYILSSNKYISKDKDIMANVDSSYMFSQFSNDIKINFSGLNTEKVENMSYMFISTPILKNLDLSSFNTSKVTNMQGMFYMARGVTTLDLSSFDTANVTDMSNMFFNCISLKTIVVDNFKTENVTNMESMFNGCTKLETLNVSNFNTSNVTTMKYMFTSGYLITTLDVSHFDTSKVENMQYMFYRCKSISELDVSNFNTQNVTIMRGMFIGINNVKKLNLTGFNTIKVTTMQEMFAECTAIQSLDLTSFNTINVTDMGYMFQSSNELKNIKIGSEFKTNNVTNMHSMFESCSSLIDLDFINQFDTGNVVYMSKMFYDCKKITNLNLSNFNTGKVEDMESIFQYCSNLTTIYGEDTFISNKLIYNSQMFTGCTNILGGANTSYNENKVNSEYARIDQGTSKPGYFTKR